LLALKNFRKEAGIYDLLMLDIKMPNMNGFELYREIKKIDDKVKVCFLTAGEMDYEQFRKESVNESTLNPLSSKIIFTARLRSGSSSTIKTLLFIIDRLLVHFVVN
jgi:CheY-like chemotaxis protein